MPTRAPGNVLPADLRIPVRLYKNRGMGLYSSIPWLFLFLLVPTLLRAQGEPADTTVNTLEEVIVVAPGGALTSGTRVVRVSAEDVRRGAHSFGEADMVASVKSLAGVSTLGSYSSGFSVEGASPAQNLHYINSAPVIFPYRFGGVFSTFNTYHFGSSTFKRAQDLAETPHLGGSLNFMPQRPRRRIEGAVNVGMTATSLSIATSFAERAYLRASGRISYLNQLYPFLLKSDHDAIGYSFADFNLTAGTRICSGDLQVNLFYNTDGLDYKNQLSTTSTKLNWANALAAAHYVLSADYTFTSDIYISGFTNKLILDSPQSLLQGPARLTTIGARFSAADSNIDKCLRFKYMADVEYYHANPQRASLEVTDGNDAVFSDFSSPRRPENMIAGGAGAEAQWDLAPQRLGLVLTAVAGFARSEIEGKRYSAPYLSPGARLMFGFSKNKIEGEVSYRNQYLHCVGFSELGLSSNFWIVANERTPMQHSLNTSVSWDTESLPFGFTAQTRIYYAQVYIQAEYRGMVLEIAQSDYDPLCRLIVAGGYNTGGSVTLSRESDEFSCSVSYSFGTGRRHLKGSRDTWRSLNSEGHSVKARAQWQHGSHWVLASSLNLASGRVITPVNAIYAIANHIVMDYGERNSARLPAQFSLNLSATYRFETTKRLPLRHAVNLSIINLTAHKNVETQYFILDSDRGTYTLKRLYSMYNFLPSVSYSIEF